MKVILINTPKGQYHLPLKKVAEHRAAHYAISNSPDHQEEVDFVMNDDFEGIDWLINNSNWEDWEADVTKVNNDVKVTDGDFWCLSEDFKLIEVN